MARVCDIKTKNKNTQLSSLLPHNSVRWGLHSRCYSQEARAPSPLRSQPETLFPWGGVPYQHLSFHPQLLSLAYETGVPCQVRRATEDLQLPHSQSRHIQSYRKQSHSKRSLSLFPLSAPEPCLEISPRQVLMSYQDNWFHWTKSSLRVLSVTVEVAVKGNCNWES